MSYNPNSSDAMLSRIIERLCEQDKVLARIEEQTTKTNGRVTKLERAHWKLLGFLSAISLAVTAAWELIKLKLT